MAFGGLLALLLILAAVSLWTIENSSIGFTQYRGLARDTNLAGRLQANMLMVRMNVKDFIITGSEKDLEQYDEYYGKNAAIHKHRAGRNSKAGTRPHGGRGRQPGQGVWSLL